MRLFLNATSPFARVARVVALEKGLSPELVWCDPWANDPALLAVHPQGRIPVLVTDDGHALAESLLIAQYLDAQGSGPTLLPAPALAATLARTSVGYGLMEAAFSTVIARKHDAQADTTVMGQRRLAALQRALAVLEADLPAHQRDWRTNEANHDDQSVGIPDPPDFECHLFHLGNHKKIYKPDWMKYCNRLKF